MKQPDQTTQLNEEQILAIKCAHADLIGALQAYEALDIHVHDWKAHTRSIEELEQAFDFIEPMLDKI
jgi:hypothetical protein